MVTEGRCGEKIRDDHGRVTARPIEELAVSSPLSDDCSDPVADDTGRTVASRSCDHPRQSVYCNGGQRAREDSLYNFPTVCICCGIGRRLTVQNLPLSERAS